jgi:hypothetical protein
MTDDLTLLREAWGPDERPSPEALRRARAALLNRIDESGTPAARIVHNGSQPHSQARSQPHSRPPSRPGLRPRGVLRRWPVRIGLTMAAVVLAVIAGVTVENLGQVDEQDRREPVIAALPFAKPANAAEVLENAAASAVRRPDVVARPDQWLYQEIRTTTTVKGGGVATGGPYETTTERSWYRIDGEQRALIDGTGRLVVKSQGDDQERWVTGPPYAELAALTTPEAVLDWLRSSRTAGLSMDKAANRRNQSAFRALNAVLRHNVLPATVEAAVYRAIGRLGGAHVNLDAVNVDGRPAISVGWVTEGWLAEEIMLDPRTYRFIGERSIAIADHRIDATDGNVFVRKGTLQIELVRVAAAIVDKPGDTR